MRLRLFAHIQRLHPGFFQAMSTGDILSRITNDLDEIEYAFTMAKALGVKAISTSTQVSVAKRVAPFADKHKMMVGYRTGDIWSPHVPPGEALQEVVRHFADCIQNEKQPLSDGALGVRVVRLKSGDAGIFGRLEEELDTLREAGIGYEIIPGVTTACVAAAQAGIPLTRRHTSRRVRV